MTIKDQAPRSLLDSVLSAENTRVDINVAALKKSQDAEKQQGEAIVELLEMSGNPSARPSLNVFA